MKDHRKLKAYDLAVSLVLAVYRATKEWPADERFGLTSQVRRAVVSISSNIVEGCARNSVREQGRFIEIAYASARETAHQLMIARLLEMSVPAAVETLADEVCRALYALHRRQLEGD